MEPTMDLLSSESLHSTEEEPEEPIPVKYEYKTTDDRMQTCFCNVSVRNASIMIAIWSILQSGLLIILTTVGLFFLDFKEPEKDQLFTLTRTELVITAIYSILDLVFGVVLFVGVRQKKAHLLMPWTYFVLFCTILYIIIHMFDGINLVFTEHVVNGLFTLAKCIVGGFFTIYFVLIVNGHYWELKEEQL